MTFPNPHKLTCWMIVSSLLAVTGCSGCHPSESPSPQSPFQPTASLVARHNQAVALMGQFDYVEACNLFQELADENPSWEDVKVDLAIATLNRQQDGDSKTANEILAKVIQANPDNLRALYCRGILAFDGGDTQAALKMFERVAKADPHDAYASYYSGLCQFQLGNVESALAWYQKSIKSDSYLNSALYGAFQASLRLGEQEQATEYREMFERMQNNPQGRVAEIKYTRMGPKAEVSTLSNISRRAAAPDGPLFRPAVELPLVAGMPPLTVAGDRPVNATLCDVNQDGRMDLFLVGVGVDAARPNVLLIGTEQGYATEQSNPLCAVSDVNAALWGDYDNDGMNDVYLLRRSSNQLWRQLADGKWLNVTETSGASGGEVDTLDGLFLDADHDGDLDLFLANDGPNELLNNNLDGSFRPLAAEQGITGNGSRTVGVLATDLDHDRDLDLVILNQHPPHEVYRNERLWRYEPASGFDKFVAAPIKAAVAVDLESDGQTELAAVSAGGLEIWRADAQGIWSVEPLATPDIATPRAPIAACDVTGDGIAELMISSDNGWVVLDAATGATKFANEQAGLAGHWRIANLQPGRGPSIVALVPDNPPRIWPPGPGRFPFLAIQFSGKDESAEQMRSNRSGIGVRAAARVGGQWSAFDSLRFDSGPGQSLQPMALGTGGAKALDFLRILWPDGVFQTEIDLAVGQTHDIDETQRQVASCPVVFAWNGEEFDFVTDVLGVAGLGFNVGFGEYGEPRPGEKLLLPAGALRAKNDSMQIKIGEPMEEACYLDAARLVAFDLPPGWQVVVDERFAVHGPPPTGNPLFYRKEQLPVSARNDRGEDLLGLLKAADHFAAEPAARDPRFIGLTKPHHVVIEFDNPIDDDDPYLMMDGWIEYPYSQTMFAAWQAQAEFRAPTIEARDSSGQWQTVAAQFGYMAGMPRRATVPLDVDRLPQGTKQLRISTNMEIYWDRLAVIHAEPQTAVRQHDLTLLAARVAEVGFARRTTHAQRRPDYDYRRRAPLWDTRHLKGLYTQFGDATPLVRHVDGALAIIGPGEEVHIEFAPCEEWLPAGWTRRYVLGLNGWCKDMDLYTRHGETVEPLPSRPGAPGTVREKLHRQYNQRYRAGY